MFASRSRVAASLDVGHRPMSVVIKGDTRHLSGSTFADLEMAGCGSSRWGMRDVGTNGDAEYLAGA